MRKNINGVEYKRCSVCGEYKPLKKFYKLVIRKPNGLLYCTEAGPCKICQNEKARAKYREKKEQNSKCGYGGTVQTKD